MSNNIVQLTDYNDNNIYPIAGAAAEGSITKTMLDEGVFVGAELSDPGNIAYVGTADIQDSAVTTAKIADLNVTEGKLASNSVTTSKIADGSVTSDKIDWTTIRQGVETGAYLPSLEANYMVIGDFCFVQLHSTSNDPAKTIGHGALVDTGIVLPVKPIAPSVYYPAVAIGTATFNTAVLVNIRDTGIPGGIRLFNSASSDVALVRLDASFWFKIKP